MTHDFKTLNIQQDVDLQPFNTLATPAMAQWYTELTDDRQLPEVRRFLAKKQCPLLVLGGGSNVVLDERFSGLVVKVSTRGRQVIAEDEQSVVVRFAAGECWHHIVMWAVEQGYYGLENLALIPGSVGAAPIQNIGAYGVELVNIFESLDAFALDTGEYLTMSAQQCQFAYRDSIFKNELKDKVIITSVTLRLYKTARLMLDYPALKMALSNTGTSLLSPMTVAQAVIRIRQSKLPDPAELPNAGSFFKNPIVSASQLKTLQRQYADIVFYPLSSGDCKLAAGWLLDKAGWKGKMVEQIAMHQQQALVLTNPHRQNGRQVLNFADRVREAIVLQFGVELEIEPRVFVH